MPDVYDVGDQATLTLTVSPSDTTTDATIVIVAPPGATAPTLTPTTVPDRSVWTAVLPLAAAGEWRPHWTVTGTGAGEQWDTLYALADPVGRVYATPGDLLAYTGDAPPAGARRLLLRASRLVDQMLRCAVYDVDSTGLPTDTDVAAALRDATTAQVAWWAETGDDTGTGAASTLAGAQIGTVKLPGGTATGGAGGGGIPAYAPAAVAALRAAGLAGGRPLVPRGPGYSRFFDTQDGV